MTDTHNKIFVTGGTGLLGSYLLRYLVQSGHTSIYALRRKNSNLALVESIAHAIHWVEGDILNMPLLDEVIGSGIEQIYHCAAMVSFHPKDIKQMRAVNIEGTANIVNLALHHQVNKLVHVSSIAAIGKDKQKTTLSESNKWENDEEASQYAISKYQSELEVWRGIAEGLNAAIVNPSIILGAGFWEVGSNVFFKNAWKNFKFAPSGTTGFVDVRDVVRFMVLLMERDIDSQRFILNGENMAINEVFTRIANVLDKKPPSITVTPLLSAIAWRLAKIMTWVTGKKPFMTKETAKAAASTYYFDNTKSLEIFDFSYTSIQQTIEETGQLFLEASREDFSPKVLSF